MIKNLPVNAGDMGLFPGPAISPGKKWQPTLVFLTGNPLSEEPGVI